MRHVLTLNGGSSSIKFALQRLDGGLSRRLSGRVERIGLDNTNLDVIDHQTTQRSILVIDSDWPSAVQRLCDWLQQHIGFAEIDAIAHRVVHGLQHAEPQPLTPALLDELKAITDYDPEHLPGELRLIEAMLERFPAITQVLCFDTAFHRTLPEVARMLPIPRRLLQHGLQRYGFHGLSYSYLTHALQRDHARLAQGKLILAHLGNGASMAAVHNGRSVDTTMGFTPCGGLVMGTRSGDLDPGIIHYLLQHEQLTPAQVNRLLNHESGLLGVSETSSDVRDLLSHEATDQRAALAIDMFCYQTRKQIGAYAAALGGLDGIVFSGGIGEHAAEIRRRICEPLGFLGVELDAQANATHARIISVARSKTSVLVIPTDEEWMMARLACDLLKLGATNR